MTQSETIELEPLNKIIDEYNGQDRDLNPDFTESPGYLRISSA